MREWKEYNFSEFTVINPTVSLKGSEEYSFVEMKDLQDGNKFCFPNAKRKTSSGARFRERDTLFARITPCLENGKICQVRGLENGVGFGSTEFLIFRGKENISDNDFVFYLSRWDEVRGFAESNFEGTSGRQRVPRNCFENLKLELPPLPEQIAISSILSSFDDKLDLLHHQNKTLGQLAETLFRQWFIVVARENWEVGKLDDIVTVKGGTTPSTTVPEYWDGTVHWTTPKDLSNHNSVFLFKTERKITEAGLSKIGSGLLPIGTVLLSSRAPIGYLAITQIPVAINQGFIAILCNKKVSKYFIYLWCKANLEEIQNSGNGSVFQEISKMTFKDLNILIPPTLILKEFDKLIVPTFQKIKNNKIQIQILTQLRDTLLPKLMSGEVRVNLNKI